MLMLVWYHIYLMEVLRKVEQKRLVHPQVYKSDNFLFPSKMLSILGTYIHRPNFIFKEIIFSIITF